MNKSELIKRISENSGISLQKTRIILKAFLESIINQIAEGDSVRLLNFGRWYVKTKSPRKSYNIATRQIEMIPARKMIAFSPSKRFLGQQIQTQEEITVELKPTSILLSLPEKGIGVNKTKYKHKKDEERSQSVTISRTGIKIDSRSPNFGKRAKQPQTEETGDLKYCGMTSYYETEVSDTNEHSYPVLMIPFIDTPILDYRINRFATGGVMEPVLLDALNVIKRIEPKIQVLQNISVPVKNRTYGYKPDIAIIWREKNIFIDIEIDEPYDIVSRKPIHYIGCSDKLRNAYFLDNGWSIIRFAEKQIANALPEVVEFVKLCLYQLAEDIRFKAERKIESIDRWSYSGAQAWAEADYRESYLGIEKVMAPDSLADESTDDTSYAGISSTIDGGTLFIKPAEDIISDRYSAIRDNISSECHARKYIVFSLKYKQYDYVALSDKISFTQEDDTYGIELYDIIEEKNIFLRFQEIASFRSVNSIIKYQAVDNDEWDKLLYDAILNSNPIEIEYDTANKGNPLKRTILFVTFRYSFFDENDNRKKYSVIQLLEAAASLKYQTLAETKHVGHITGFCNYRQDLRTFNIHRIKSGRIFDCHKNLHKITVNDIWKLLEKGYADIAISMYNELQEQEKNYLFYLGNYANALVMQSKHIEAVLIYRSIPADTVMPQSSTTWKEVCTGDFDFFISKDIKKDEFEKIQITMKKFGW